jgi:hypothetical protein
MDNILKENLSKNLPEKKFEHSTIENNFEIIKGKDEKQEFKKEIINTLPKPINKSTTDQDEFSQSAHQEIEQLEEILSAGLENIYQDLSLDAKKIFKVKGEQAASRIQLLLQDSKVKINGILEIIRSWLLAIPGINRFFLEQEAKIKTDKIISWHDHT